MRGEQTIGSQGEEPLVRRSTQTRQSRVRSGEERAAGKHRSKWRRHVVTDVVRSGMGTAAHQWVVCMQIWLSVSCRLLRMR